MKSSIAISGLLLVSLTNTLVLPAKAQSIDYSEGQQQTAECRAANDPAVQWSDRILAGAAGAAACFGAGLVFTPAAGAVGAVVCGMAMAAIPPSDSDCNWTHQVEGDMFVTPSGETYRRTGSHQKNTPTADVIFTEEGEILQKLPGDRQLPVYSLDGHYEPLIITP